MRQLIHGIIDSGDKFMNITVEDLKAAATNSTTYSRGLDYYRRGMVRDIRCSEDKDIITARVRGNQDYYVGIHLDAEGHIDDAQCTCPAFDKYSGYCKHIIAALFEARNRYGDDNGKNRYPWDHRRENIRIAAEKEGARRFGNSAGGKLPG